MSLIDLNIIHYGIGYPILVVDLTAPLRNLVGETLILAAEYAVLLCTSMQSESTLTRQVPLCNNKGHSPRVICFSLNMNNHTTLWLTVLAFHSNIVFKYGSAQGPRFEVVRQK